jgi:hypothetical protein
VTDPLTPFDPALVARVAAEHGFDAGVLAALVRRHHEYAARVPGIDELVFEWRRTFAYDPLVARTDDAYYLVVDSNIWTEFATQMRLDDNEIAALRALHNRQARRHAAGREEPAVFGDRAPLLLAR